MNELLQLDDDTQRRLLLQAAKSVSADQFAELRKACPTVQEYDNETSQYLWGLIVFGFFFAFLPWLALPFVLRGRHRLRHRLRDNWRAWLGQPDRECQQIVLVNSLRISLRSLPRSARRHVKSIRQELDRASRTWSDLQNRLQKVEGGLIGQATQRLDERIASIDDRLALETDSMMRASLQSQADAIRGQREATATLEMWRMRLRTAQDECTESLLHLRSRLSLLAATAGNETTAITEVTTELDDINARLAATQSAAEEVLQLRV